MVCDELGDLLDATPHAKDEYDAVILEIDE